MHGQTVCQLHGGKAPQALRKAEERMRDLVHPAISALERLINGNDFNATRYVLDYAGFRAAVQVNSDSEVTIRIVREEQPLSLDTSYQANGTNGRAHD
jgi:hypothetical protein